MEWKFIEYPKAEPLVPTITEAEINELKERHLRMLKENEQQQSP